MRRVGGSPPHRHPQEAPRRWLSIWALVGFWPADPASEADDVIHYDVDTLDALDALDGHTVDYNSDYD